MPPSSVLLVALSLLAGASATSYCNTDGSSYSYSEEVDSMYRTITYNGCPNHVHTNAIGNNPNKAVKKSMTFTVPLYPMYEDGEQADLSSKGGVTGVTRAGEMIFSPYGGPNYGAVTAYSNSAPKAEGDTFDECGAHASSDSAASYHIHIPPSCLLQQLGQTDAAHSPQIGWAGDGFPVYGPRGPNGVMMQTCTVTGGTYGTDICTDDCTGYSNSSIGDGYNYRYYVLGTYHTSTGVCDSPTADGEGSADYYPFTPVCMNGCKPTSSMSISLSSINTCTSSAVTGYTSVQGALDALETNTEACAGGTNDTSESTKGPPIIIIVVALVVAVFGCGCLYKMYSPGQNAPQHGAPAKGKNPIMV